MTAAVDVANLTKRYRARSENAVDHVAFRLEEGEIIGLLGRNGAGKTTLIKMLCGVVPPSEGSIIVLGLDLKLASMEVKRLIGVAHQRLTFDMFLTGRDNLQIAAALRGLRWSHVKSTADGLVNIFGLQNKLSVPVWTLSGGEMRRLQVVRALLKVPRLLFLDEPSAGLDVEGRHQVWSLLHQLRNDNGVTILWTSHYVEELERNCDRVMIIDRGRLVRFDRTSALIQEYGRPRFVLQFPDMVDERIRAALSNIGTPRVRIDGKRVEVYTDRQHDSLPVILDNLQHAGLHPQDIHVIPAGLEDAFLSLLEDTRQE